MERGDPERGAGAAGDWSENRERIAELLGPDPPSGSIAQLYRAVIEQIPDGVYIIDPSTKRLLLTNRAFADLLGYSDEELRRLTLYEIVAHDAQSIDANVARVLEGGRLALAERQLRRKDGSLVDVEINVTRSTYGPRHALVAVVRDLTERKRMALDLRTSQRNHEALIHAIDGVAWEVDPKTFRFLSVSPQAERLLGYPIEQWQREESFWYNHLHAEDRDAALAYRLKSTADRRDHRFVYRMLAADGRTVWVDDFVTVAVKDGEITRMTGVLVDISERKHAEEELQRTESQLRMVVDNVPIILFALDAAGTVTLSKGKGLESVGLGPQDLIGRSMFDLYRDDPNALEQLKKALEGEPVHATVQPQAGPGKGMTLEIRSITVRGADGRVRNVIGIATDVTGRRLAEEGLKRAEERLHTVVSSAPIILYAFDRDGIVTLSEGRSLEALGLKPGQVVGQNVFEMYRDDPEILANLRRALSGEAFTVVSEVHAGIGTGMTFETHFLPILAADGGLNGAIGVSTDVTEHKRLETKVHHISYHDALTDLPNWALFKDRLAQAVTNAQRTQEVLAVLLLDIDRFKMVNDTLGHAVGERLLQAVAVRLKGCIRPIDTLARMGGDEFVILQAGIAHAGDAARIAQKVLETVKAPFTCDGHQLHITMSVGISLFPYDGEDAQTLLKNADTAMYHAKDSGRCNYHFYSPAMNAKAFEKLALENSLRQALEREEFLLHYQPQVDIRTGRMIGMEALARWRHPDLGLVAPAKFIPLAEDTGVIVPLGEWILRAACKQNKAWQAAGLTPVRVAVNLSARQFHQPDLPEMVVRALRDTGLEPRYLEFEITESIAMKDPEFTTRVLRDFKKIGVQISVDDFGTGYSSLSSLKNFPLDALKIDRSFIQDLNTDSNDAAIATALIALGHRLNMRVIAEGVETEAQLQTLLALDCDMMQGHLFCRPLPPEDLRQVLERGARLYTAGNEPSLF